MTRRVVCVPNAIEYQSFLCEYKWPTFDLRPNLVAISIEMLSTQHYWLMDTSPFCFVVHNLYLWLSGGLLHTKKRTNARMDIWIALNESIKGGRNGKTYLVFSSIPYFNKHLILQDLKIKYNLVTQYFYTHVDDLLIVYSFWFTSNVKWGWQV